MSDAPAFIDQLPEDIRGDAAFAEIKDVGTLAKSYLAARQPPEFTSLLPEEIRGEAYFKDLRDVQALATKAFHQAKLIGRDPATMLVLPGADAKPEEWAQIYDRLGRPEAPDKYQLVDPQDVPAELVNGEAKSAFAGKAHELGLNQRQADTIYQFVNANRIAGYNRAMQAEATALTALETSLKTELGGEYDRHVEDGNLAVDHLDQKAKLGGKLSEAFKHLPAAAREPLFKAFAAYGSTLREDGVLPGRSGDSGFGAGMTPARAMQERAALYADKTFMEQYRSTNRQIRQGAIDRMQVLNEAIATGQASAA